MTIYYDHGLCLDFTIFRFHSQYLKVMTMNFIKNTPVGVIFGPLGGRGQFPKFRKNQKRLILAKNHSQKFSKCKKDPNPKMVP